MSIQNTLQQRGKRYGEFKDVAQLSNDLMRLLQAAPNYHQSLSDSQHFALVMMTNKMARIVNGDPNYLDNWHDIAGYATLVEQELIMTGHDKEAV
ncbi:TPA: hypothetical protein MIV70_27730 [Klebsiella pneumoniae]|uniref:DUF6378 domain-containing protein n=1 Tax=Acinetobacter baumannii TaxID=470 RepID=UPI000716FAEB|nr:DUF6378 domain-containing protein [Acinetobacter baumannii]SWT44424.1 Uncharacterised protein [Klebsiella pneumoniae]EHU1403009.1 hypothetical protein [Acinetobacter baumannii]EHU2564549.1 hypothetical protein [Acinetobacter baumannii]KRS01460.1 hypothetical protein ASM28_06640 [Acinetobacter baumannii]MCF4224883.1 DUF6378 domain-containing protein [Acinetobacter baumannii]